MDSNLTVSYVVTAIVSLIVSLSIHEAMHAFVSLKLGDTTAYEHGRVSFNPIRHIDPFGTVLLPIITLFLFGAPILIAKPVPFNPARVKFDEFGAALIGLAGPLTNLVLALIGAVLYHVFAASSGITYVLGIFVLLNIAIFIFNMIPVPPLDGSRVLYAFAPEPLQQVMGQMERYGIFLVFALVVFVPSFSNLLINLDNGLLRLLRLS